MAHGKQASMGIEMSPRECRRRDPPRLGESGELEPTKKTLTHTGALQRTVLAGATQGVMSLVLAGATSGICLRKTEDSVIPLTGQSRTNYSPRGIDRVVSADHETPGHTSAQ